ncbi:phage tail tape measure protein [uncultured Sphingomonas sp.]|uniref:phage tail tape measure protein n=1 Tax=uncultured Sphingomonas sp. TaxID=158754 RepID=UPI00258B439D|nr:phage tail tape measure protein [uncultured Sphingomonas sp.]
MADRDLRLRILMDAADRVSRPLRDITGGSRRAADALRGTRQELQKIGDAQGQIDAFRTLKASMRGSATAMEAAQARAAALGREIAQVATPTKAMTREFEKAKREAAQLESQHQTQTQQLQDLRTRLREAGIDTRNLAHHDRDLRDRSRDLTRTLDEQGRELERLTGRQQRFGAARDRFNRTMGTAQNVASAGMGMLATAGAMAVPIVAGVKAAQEFESKMTDIGQKADLSRAATARMGMELLKAGRAANQLPEAMQGGVDTLAGFGLDPRQATAMMQPIGKAATAYKAEIADLAAAGFAVHDNLKVSIADTSRVIDGMAAAGKAGAFEVKDMAQHMPALTAAYQGLGQQDVSASNDLAAALQITRKGAGDSATAAGNLGNVLQKITSPATVKAFEKMGVDLPSALKRMYAEGKTPIEAIAELTNSTLKGDLSRMGYLFEDAQVQAGLRPLIQNMDEFRRIREEAGKAGGTTDRDFAERMKDSAERTKQLTVNAQTLGIQLGTVLLPTVNDLLGKAAAMAGRLGDWSQRHPALTKGIVLLAVGLTALLGAAALLTLGYAALMGPMALFGALSTATGMAMLPLIGIVLGVVAAVALLAYGAYLIYQNWDGIAAYFGGIWDRIAGFFTSNWTTIRNLLLGALVIFMPVVAALIWVAAAVYRNWDTIKAGFMSGITALWGYVQPIVQPILNILSTIENLRQRFFRMGGDLIMGLLRGLISAAGGVLRFVGNLAARIGQRFADALGIRSPSRVFMAHGGHLMTGLQRGIDRGADGPIGRMTRLSRELGGAMVLGAATPAIAGTAPPTGAGGSGFSTMSVTIHINGADRAPGEIGREVEEALERIEARRRAAAYSSFADRPDWNV